MNCYSCIVKFGGQKLASILVAIVSFNLSSISLFLLYLLSRFHCLLKFQKLKIRTSEALFRAASLLHQLKLDKRISYTSFRVVGKVLMVSFNFNLFFMPTGLVEICQTDSVYETVEITELFNVSYFREECYCLNNQEILAKLSHLLFLKTVSFVGEQGTWLSSWDYNIFGGENLQIKN